MNIYTYTWSLPGHPSVIWNLLSVTSGNRILAAFGPRSNVTEYLLLPGAGEVEPGGLQATVFLGGRLDGDNVEVVRVCRHNHLGMGNGLLGC